MITREYKCILHFEGSRVDKSFASMIEAINAMQEAMIVAKRKPIFAEVIVITTERVAYQSRLKEIL